MVVASTCHTATPFAFSRNLPGAPPVGAGMAFDEGEPSAFFPMRKSAFGNVLNSCGAAPAIRRSARGYLLASIYSAYLGNTVPSKPLSIESRIILSTFPSAVMKNAAHVLLLPIHER
jgi:hypothetical protein